MITRVWHGMTRKEHADSYREYVIKTGVREYRSTGGNLGVQIWQKDEGDITHIWTVTLWRDLDSVRSFAGEDIGKARYYPEDKQYLLECEPEVRHYHAHVFPVHSPGSIWRITI